MNIPKLCIALAALSIMIACVAPAQADTTVITYSIANFTPHPLTLVERSRDLEEFDPDEFLFNDFKPYFEPNNFDVKADRSSVFDIKYYTQYSDPLSPRPKALSNRLVYSNGEKVCTFETTLTILELHAFPPPHLIPKRAAKATSTGASAADCQVQKLYGSKKQPFNYTVQFSIQ